MPQCLNCQKELKQIPKKRPKQFCNSTCRSNYWQKEKRKNNSFDGIIPTIKKSNPIPFSHPKKENINNFLDKEVMPEGLHWKEQLEWKRNHKK